jgi:hypothetical protein
LPAILSGTDSDLPHEHLNLIAIEAPPQSIR